MHDKARPTHRSAGRHRRAAFRCRVQHLTALQQAADGILDRPVTDAGELRDFPVAFFNQRRCGEQSQDNA
jgi:hypothetical protein